MKNKNIELSKIEEKKINLEKLREIQNNKNNNLQLLFKEEELNNNEMMTTDKDKISFDDKTAMSLECSCGGELILSVDNYSEEKKMQKITIKNALVLKCKECSKLYKTVHLLQITNAFYMSKSNNHIFQFETFSSQIEKNYWVEDEKIKFIFSKNDYFSFPGLYLFDDNEVGALTPVYFQFDVLLKYKYDPCYEVNINSTTYSHISKENEWVINFGINSNKLVIMWLKDILGLPLNEQYYLRAFNINSDHHLASGFYDGQINSKFPKKSNEQRLFEAKKKVFENIKIKYDFEIMSYFDETDKIFYTINKPIYKSRKAFDNEIIDLNKVLVESLSEKYLRKYLADLNIGKLEKLGSLQLLKKFIMKEFYFSDDEAFVLLTPLFVLSGLRNCAGHLKNQEEYDAEFKKGMALLGLNKDSEDFLLIYDTLIEKLKDNFEKLAELTSIQGEK